MQHTKYIRKKHKVQWSRSLLLKLFKLREYNTYVIFCIWRIGWNNFIIVCDFKAEYHKVRDWNIKCFQEKERIYPSYYMPHSSLWKVWKVYVDLFYYLSICYYIYALERVTWLHRILEKLIHITSMTNWIVWSIRCFQFSFLSTYWKTFVYYCCIENMYTYDDI